MEAHEEHMEDILERVSGVLQECHNTDDGSIDQLDVLSFNMRSCSAELGGLLHEMMFSYTYDENQLSTILDLTHCVTELANYYECRLLQLSQRNSSVGMGRPQKFINTAMVELLLEMRYTWDQIAEVLMVSRTTLWRRMDQLGLAFSKYSEISNMELDAVMELLVKSYPRSGIIMMWGHLRGMNIIVTRKRIHESLLRVSPRILGQRQTHAVSRRVYNVHSSNSLWHIDGLHCLVRWKVIIHGGIDGFSRRIVYLHASGNNKAETVLKQFRKAVAECGWPSRVRSDKGGENVEVAKAMINVRGVGRKSHLTGSSVHNQRIECLWRDTFRCVGQLYYALFYEMEDSNLLCIDSDTDLFCLHYVFLTRINSQLNQFASAWNDHPIRTENGLSPLQLWTRGLLSAAPSHQAEIFDGMTVGDDYGVECNTSSQGISTDQAVIVPEIDIDLTVEQIAYIGQNFNPLRRSDYNGLDVYLELKEYIQNL